MIRDSSALSDDISSEELTKFRDADPFRTRKIGLTATLFELLEDWRRSEQLYRRALGVVIGSDRATKSFRETAYVFLLRLARVHLRVGSLRDASREFREALEYAIDVRREEQPRFTRSGAVAYALLEMLKEPLRHCKDETVVRLFGLLNGQFAGDGAVQAWMRYGESESLFERFMVQAAKRRLTEAMDVARSSSEHDLYWLIAQQRLFYRVHQMYRRQEDWLRDALEVVLALASDADLAPHQGSFADSVVRLVGGFTQGPFLVVESAVKRIDKRRQDHAFLVIAYAIWQAAGSAHMLSTSRNELEVILRRKADFLKESDFE